MCNWTVRYRDGHPGQLVIAHYIGSTSASADLGLMLRRIIEEIKEFYSIKKDVPKDLKDLIDAFPDWIRDASSRGGLVLVLDALNQLDPSNNAHDLGWLPKTFPDNVKIVASTLPGKCENVIKTRKWKTVEIQPLSEKERESLINEYMSICGKSLTKEQVNTILQSNQCNNPLFLRTLLEELRVFGVFEQIEEKIRLYLSSSSISEVDLCN